MKYVFSIITFFLVNNLLSQDAMFFIQKVWQQQREIKSVSYKLVRNDILVTGDTRQIKGEAYYNLSDTAIEFDLKRLDARHELFQTAGALLFAQAVRT